MSDDIKEIVREKYARAALRVTAVEGASCCGSASSRGECDPITSGIYAGSDTSALPAEARAASLGCGNPTALAELEPGRDRARSRIGRRHRRAAVRRRVGPTGKAYGLDMTDEMLALARENQRKAGRDQRGVPQGRDRADPSSRRARWTSSSPTA